jgi:hypothetical protein
MIRKGDRLENPVTGEVLIFHRTAEETHGESVLFETILQPAARRGRSPDAGPHGRNGPAPSRKNERRRCANTRRSNGIIQQFPAQFR